MSKKMYSPELKLEIIQCYLKNGESITLLAREYHIGSRADIRKWIAQYKENRLSGLSTTHGTYTGEFKVSVVEYMHITGASIRATAAHFNIPSSQTVNIGNVFMMNREKMPCIQNREAGLIKWERNVHGNRKLR